MIGGATRRLAQGAIITYLVQVAGAGLALGAQIILANLMGVTEYGVFVYVFSWLTILQMGVLLGMDRTVIRFLAEYASRDDFGHAKGLLVYAHSRVFLLGLVVAAVIAVAGVFMYLGEIGQYALTFVVGAAVLPFMALCLLRQAVLQGLKHAPIAQVPELIVRPIMLALIAWLVFEMMGGELVGPAGMAVYGAAVMVAFSVGGVAMSRTVEKSVWTAKSDIDHRAWLQMAMPILAISVCHIVNKRADVLFVGSILGSDAAGVYGAASRYTDVVVFGLAAVNIVAAPYIAEYYAKDNRVGLERIVRLTAWGALALCVPAAAVFIFLGQPLLQLFGEEFGVGYVPMVILVVGQVGNAATGPVGVILTMTGRQRQAAYIVGTLVLSNIALNAVLVNLYGMHGAAIATAITTIANNVIVMVYVIRIMGINPTAFGLLPKGTS